MSEEFCLSDKIFYLGNQKQLGECKFVEYNGNGNFINPNDVKEFIKKLKEEIGSYDELYSDDVFEWIDKLAGEKLI